MQKFVFLRTFLINLLFCQDSFLLSAGYFDFFNLSSSFLSNIFSAKATLDGFNFSICLRQKSSRDKSSTAKSF